MCGVIGIIGTRNVVDDLVTGLRMLEYRGYDSTGIATMDQGEILRRRAEGKLHNLEKLLHSDPIMGTRGIGHTRWATHGIPSERNAHPHISKYLAIVHNGIIENYDQLADELPLPRSAYVSDTDTEVLAHWLSHLIAKGHTPQDAVKILLPKLHGAFAFVVLFSDPDAPMIGARRGSPLAIGHGDGEMYFGSDALALSSCTSRITYLEEGDWAILHADSLRIFDAKNQPVERSKVTSAYSGAMIGKGNYRHFMLKEIHEQPTVFANALA
ncbi:MAG: glutamine--fructose-6-phosphate aminotransferase, partial [Pseudomonadota bacterium]